MFTGIIEDLGTIVAVNHDKLEVRTLLGQIANGDSISVNGVCLTVTTVTPSGKMTTVTFDYTPETASHTSLGKLKPGNLVNLERALRADSRLGGHMVSGHIEGAWPIISIVHKGNSYIFTFETIQNLMKYIVNKGSVAIEGISLTVADRSDNNFSVSVIPYTYSNTSLKFKKTGDLVNIETDVIAKYIENISIHNTKNKLSLKFLSENGFK